MGNGRYAAVPVKWRIDQFKNSRGDYHIPLDDLFQFMYRGVVIIHQFNELLERRRNGGQAIHVEKEAPGAVDVCRRKNAFVRHECYALELRTQESVSMLDYF